jgi:transaldolase/glucose-6-phosphate isomerase
MRLALRRRTRCATTLGFEPRFLHSTGQLHKGGADNGVFLQITMAPARDIDIPNEGISFGVLQRAQAWGDYEALAARGRRILRIQAEGEGALGQILQAFG